MQIEAIPGVRCLDSAREVVNGHCGQTPKWEIPLQGWVTLLQFPAAQGHPGRDQAMVSPVCMERENDEFALHWKELYSADFFFFRNI